MKWLCLEYALLTSRITFKNFKHIFVTSMTSLESRLALSTSGPEWHKIQTDCLADSLLYNIYCIYTLVYDLICHFALQYCSSIQCGNKLPFTTALHKIWLCIRSDNAWPDVGPRLWVMRISTVVAYLKFYMFMFGANWYL